MAGGRLSLWTARSVSGHCQRSGVGLCPPAAGLFCVDAVYRQCFLLATFLVEFARYDHRRARGIRTRAVASDRDQWFGLVINPGLETHFGEPGVCVGPLVAPAGRWCAAGIYPARSSPVAPPTQMVSKLGTMEEKFAIRRQPNALYT